MAMTITMRMVARVFVFVTEVTQGPLSSVHYTHIKHTPKSRCTICSGFEDTTKMFPRSRGTCPGDLAGDLEETRQAPHDACRGVKLIFLNSPSVKTPTEETGSLVEKTPNLQ
jgi:hypothetical protein